ncbi:MAG TPA: hypothetical protein VFE31_08325 [Opitutaceae bacterium]|jgi:hypothetical protein|nr:hypothetical protein [Opitutaceae bacterium]
MTAEHVTAKWIGKLFPQQNPYTFNSIRRRDFTANNSLIRDVAEESRGSGDPISRRAKIVCAECNNGWMKDFQDGAKPILVPFFNGTLLSLNRPQQKVLAAWATMTAMVMEYVRRPIIVPQAERTRLRKDLTALPTWMIWMGRYGGGQWGHSFIHRNVAAQRRSAPLSERGYVDKAIGDTQITTFIAGTAVFQALSTRGAAILLSVAKHHRPDRSMVQLWPIERDDLILPTTLVDDACLDWLKANPVSLVSRLLPSANDLLLG